MYQIDERLNELSNSSNNIELISIQSIQPDLLGNVALHIIMSCIKTTYILARYVRNLPLLWEKKSVNSWAMGIP